MMVVPSLALAAETNPFVRQRDMNMESFMAGEVRALFGPSESKAGLSFQAWVFLEATRHESEWNV